MALALSIGKCSLLGNYRENNEDSIDVQLFPDMTVCLVADGMGGQAAGEVASKRAVEIVPRKLKKRLGATVSNEDAKVIVRRAVVQANEEIMSLAALDRELKNMGTTIVLTLWRKGSSLMYVAGMGDSRVYLVQPKKIEQLTVDHSIAQALVEAKTISAAEGAPTATATSCGNISARPRWAKDRRSRLCKCRPATASCFARTG